MSDAALAARLNRHLVAVRLRRQKLGLRAWLRPKWTRVRSWDYWARHRMLRSPPIRPHPDAVANGGANSASPNWITHSRPTPEELVASAPRPTRRLRAPEPQPPSPIRGKRQLLKRPPIRPRRQPKHSTTTRNHANEPHLPGQSQQSRTPRLEGNDISPTDWNWNPPCGNISIISGRVNYYVVCLLALAPAGQSIYPIGEKLVRMMQRGTRTNLWCVNHSAAAAPSGAGCVTQSRNIWRPPTRSRHLETVFEPCWGVMRAREHKKDARGWIQDCGSFSKNALARRAAASGPVFSLACAAGLSGSYGEDSTTARSRRRGGTPAVRAARCEHAA